MCFVLACESDGRRKKKTPWKKHRLGAVFVWGCFGRRKTGRRSKNYIKFDNLHDLNKAIEKIEEFEAKAFKIGYKKSEKDKYTESSRNLMTDEAALSYDELIDSLSYSQEEPA